MAEESENQKDKQPLDQTESEETSKSGNESHDESKADEGSQIEDENTPLPSTAESTDDEDDSIEDTTTLNEVQDDQVSVTSEEEKEAAGETLMKDEAPLDEEAESDQNESAPKIEAEPKPTTSEVETDQTSPTAEATDEEGTEESPISTADASEETTEGVSSDAGDETTDSNQNESDPEIVAEPELTSSEIEADQTSPTAEGTSESADEEVAEESPKPAAESSEETGEGVSSDAGDDAKESEKEEEDEPEEEVETPDYSQFSREELAREIEGLAKGDEVRSISDKVRELKSNFDDLEEVQRQQALEAYVKDGGDPEGFEYRPDEYYTLFYAAYDNIRERRSQHRAQRERTRQENLQAKESVLNRLREFVDSEETQVSITKLKDLQQEWRSIGEVPSSLNRSLWANYHALLDRFYDNRSIYFELKELDRKKNLVSKIAIAERAEQLGEEPDIKKAARELDELHEEYKHIGPVPREEQESLWQRFKAASDKIHDRRREDVESFKEQLQKNLEEKLKLVEEVKEFASFTSESIKEWNKKTKELQQLQKRWEAAGSMPRNQAKNVNRLFWSTFKEFFAHKGEFFQRLDAQREENLQKKEVLVEKAESLKESDDWKSTSNDLKRLQREWKDIGPVPEKARESVYQRFKAACDTFFNRRRNNSQETEIEYQKNLKAREAICEKIEALAQEKSSDTVQLTELTQQYNDIGFVPRSAINSISERFQKAVNQFMENAEKLDENQKKEVLVEVELGAMKGAPGGKRKINQKEGNIRRQIKRLEDDISIWKNNITFFTSSSKQADKLIADVERKIEKASAELEQLKSQLDMLQNLK